MMAVKNMLQSNSQSKSELSSLVQDALGHKHQQFFETCCLYLTAVMLSKGPFAPHTRQTSACAHISNVYKNKINITTCEYNSIILYLCTVYV